MVTQLVEVGVVIGACYLHVGAFWFDWVEPKNHNKNKIIILFIPQNQNITMKINIS